MYERMLDKNNTPTFEMMADYCGNSRELFLEINRFLSEKLATDSVIRFPYGNKYGWSMNHRIGKKSICDIFAEAGALTLMCRLSNKQFASIYDELHDYTKKYIDKKYPCGDGGWIHYRITSRENLEDARKLLAVKCNNK